MKAGDWRPYLVDWTICGFFTRTARWRGLADPKRVSRWTLDVFSAVVFDAATMVGWVLKSNVVVEGGLVESSVAIENRLVVGPGVSLVV